MYQLGHMTPNKVKNTPQYYINLLLRFYQSRLHRVYAQGPYIGFMDLVRIDFILGNAGPQAQRDFARPYATLHNLARPYAILESQI